MTSSNLNRRKFITQATAAGVFAPAIMRATLVDAKAVSDVAGQLLMLGLPGSSASSRSAKAFAKHIQAGRIGGFLALRHNVKSREGIISLTNSFLNLRPDLYTAIDQEGGKVQRLSKGQGFAKIPTAQWVAGNLSAAKALSLYEKAGRDLRSAGFNLNLAPSVDIHQPKNPVIGKYGRSFGTDPATIAEYGGAFVNGFARAGVATSIKHFPGHGSSRSDSHDGFVDISSTWKANELAPFKALAAKAPIIMGGHLYHPKFSNGKNPVTFSSKALQKTLRGTLGYKGVILTDDLDMGAIRKNYTLKEAVVNALTAGNDLLMLSNSLKYDEDLPVNAVKWIGEAVKDGRITTAQLNGSYQRVMAARARSRF
ncbi:MAG: glycoside hydrolase family 3 N-terminal domain-containing protein [Nitratireductor sp.]